MIVHLASKDYIYPKSKTQFTAKKQILLSHVFGPLFTVCPLLKLICFVGPSTCLGENKKKKQKKKLEWLVSTHFLEGRANKIEKVG